MIDLNNPETVEHIQKVATSSNGKLIIEYFKQEIDSKFSFENLDVAEEDKVLGQKTRAIKEIQDFIKEKIDFLTSE